MISVEASKTIKGSPLYTIYDIGIITDIVNHINSMSSINECGFRRAGSVRHRSGRGCGGRGNLQIILACSSFPHCRAHNFLLATKNVLPSLQDHALVKLFYFFIIIEYSCQLYVLCYLRL